MKHLAYLLVITGILVMLYPLAGGLYSRYLQQQLLDDWEQDAQAVGEEDPAGFNPRGFEDGAVIARLRIERIDLEVPVLWGATEANLRLGAALHEDSAGIGQEGNAVIAAHRSHTPGMLFNRLQEVEAGDEVVLETREDSYRYVVFRQSVVRPDNLPPAEVGGDERLLTLVTCHPLYSPNPPWRLVVQAKDAGL